MSLSARSLTGRSQPVHGALMRQGAPHGKVEGEGTRGSFARIIMRRINFLAIALGVLAAPLAVVLSAKADLAQLNDGAPLTVINSTGGRITVHPGEPDGLVRVPNNAAAQRPQAFENKRGYHPPGQNPNLNPNLNANPNCRVTHLPLREGPHGVAINNPGSDLEVSVPSRFELMYIKANASPVLMERTRGPFIITGQNDVALHGVAGMGYVQTAGNVDVRNPAGILGVATSVGRITIASGPALERLQLYSQSGDIEWTASAAARIGSNSVLGRHASMCGRASVRMSTRRVSAARWSTCSIRPSPTSDSQVRTRSR